MHEDMFDNGDVLRIQAFIAKYIWLLDMGDVEGVVGLFEPDGLFEDTAGTEYPTRDAIAGYFAGLTSAPAFRGRQHHIDSFLIEPTDDGYLVRSYWHVTKWRAADGQKLIESIGHSVDRLRRRGHGFGFVERRVHHWRDADCPWKPAGTAV